MNRHGKRLTNFRLTDEEVIKSLYHGNGEWMAINGEYMNKSKNDKFTKLFNHKFVIFDILILKGNYLLGSTFEERIEILDDIYGQVECEDEFLFKLSENIYRVKSYKKDFNDTFTKLIEIDMYEGLVIKRRNAKLELGTSEMNNVRSQIKCRRKTKNYPY
jgi:ATP-dependent DNA ligase